MPLKLATTRDCGGGVQFIAGTTGTSTITAVRSFFVRRVGVIIRSGANPAQELNPGDVVNIPPEVKHWHGAAPDSWFAHIAISVPGSKAEWLEPVDEAEYTKLK